jgi:hypothetical protein
MQKPTPKYTLHLVLRPEKNQSRRAQQAPALSTAAIVGCFYGLAIMAILSGIVYALYRLGGFSK